MSAQSAIFNPSQTTSAASGDGFSVPRLTTTGRLAITFTAADKGMMVYDTTLNNLFIWNGSAWESVPASGDAGADGAVQFNDNGVVSGAANFYWSKVQQKVGIGTNSPNVELDVVGNSSITGDLTVRTNKLKVDSTGVAIGATSAAYLLDVRGTDTTNALIAGTTKGIRFVASASTSSIVGVDNTGAASYQPLSIGGSALDFSLSGSTAMTLNSTGLGIGVTPNRNLDIRQDQSAATIARIQNQSVNAAAYSQVNLAASGNNWGILVGSSAANSNRLEFVVDPSGTNLSVMRLDTSGNVGIGVTPSSLWAIGKVLQIGSTSGSFLYGSGGQSIAGVNAYYDTAWKYAANGRANYYQQSSGIHSWFYDSGTQVAGTAANFVQAMTLDASGNLLVTKTSYGLSVGFAAASTGSIDSVMASAVSAQSTLNVYSTGAAAYRFYVGMNGTINATNTTISAISDARLKENVQDIDVGLGAILALKPRKFDWKEGKGKNIKGDRGFIAQEFEQVFPQLVDEWKDAAPEGEAPYKSVRQDLIPVLVKAIQELTARVQTLETR